jgi:hypothetical protein
MQFTYNEYKELDGYLAACGHNRGGCPVFWSGKPSFGLYSPNPEMILINSACKGEIRLITPCVVHELVHRTQRKRARLLLLYYFGLFFLRYWFEKEAVAAEREAEMLLSIDLG